MSFMNIEVYWSILFIIVLFSFVGVILNHYLPKFLQHRIYLLASYWLAALTYFTICITSLNLINMLGVWFHLMPLQILSKGNDSFRIGLLVLITVSILLVYGTINAKNLRVTSYKLNIEKQAGSLKRVHIVLLSDIHLSDLKDKGMKKLVEKINGIKPDIVLFAGDIIDANRDMAIYDFDSMQNHFKNVKSKYGIYASLGNHDYDHNGDSTNRIDNFEKAGINILRDSVINIDKSFYIIGREDKFYERINGAKRKDLLEIMAGIDKNLPTIVLDHQPSNLEEPIKAGVDLQLSGHTHKGQFFPFNLITKRVFKKDYGYLKIGNFQIIVSSGARTWGPPIRIGSKSEIVDIEIQFL
ncbi:metallophosphoesterase [Clostridium chromiireducens]|nr:metallophosphoesterase [Clostridium chromiireducens]